MIRISVALVTRNRPKSLNRCLQSLRHQNVQPFEIVISDDSDSDFSSQVKCLSNHWGCRYITGPRRGLYANRNHVALACEGTHIRTMDDDHEFPEGHMERCLEAVTNDPVSIWTTGEVGLIEGQQLWYAETANQLCPSGVGGRVMNVNDNWSISDGSTIYPRTVFDRGHRMFEEYRYGSSYLEFGAYLYRHGFRSRCIRDTIVIHHANLETIKRDTLDAITSRLFASLCFNIYFRRNIPLALKYILSYHFRFLKRGNLELNLLSLLSSIHQRWADNS